MRVILALAAQYDLEAEQDDVDSAFLNSHLKEEIYMEQPEGFQDASGQVLLLKKALYGLKQASQCWFKTLGALLADAGLTQAHADQCVFVGN